MKTLLLFAVTNLFIYEDGSLDIQKTRTAVKTQTIVHNETKFSRYISGSNWAVWLQGLPAVDVTKLELIRKLQECQAQICLVRPKQEKRILFHEGSSLNVSQ